MLTSRSKKLILAAMCTAILIVSQLVLSGIVGLEAVTVLLLSFCFSFGASTGVLISTSFSLVRCLLFGFQPNVVILYLLYYNLFALFFGWLGKRLSGRLTVSGTVVVVLCGALFTVLFTALDNVITPVVFGFNMSAAMAYAYASLAAVIPQTVCTVLTVSVLFVPLTAMLSRIKSADIFK